jgi:hypothetical protein
MKVVNDGEQTPQYDPSKKYRWSPSDEFTFSGSEFGVVLNALRALVSTQEAQRIILADKASEIMEMALARAVENGTVKEDNETND